MPRSQMGRSLETLSAARRYATGQWQEAAEDALHVQWARDCWQALTPWTSNAVEMNTLSAGEDPQVVRASYGSNYPRLAALKARLDPQNLFRMNQNIPPAP